MKLVNNLMYKLGYITIAAHKEILAEWTKPAKSKQNKRRKATKK